MGYMMSDTYKIIRHYHDKRARVMKRGLTLEQAQAHCNDPEASSSTCKTAKAKVITRRNREWFDTWTKE